MKSKKRYHYRNPLIRRLNERLVNDRVLLIRALCDVIAMVDASSFGSGYYRCLTPEELQRLEQCRSLLAGVRKI
jgi:hypothetical protein